ncbi:hypothetical protein DPMN_076423 [Dreissena polymorpha]|uniref:SEA domain-containing protein n=2 Tax=Dreissena polymorpha TaxID=45954 RepID=A0A9D3YMB5_DREPO|nr:hypothetical protein DPMN_076423 [Dreissena polymorpha]
MGNRVEKVIIHSIKIGSLTVNLTIIKDNSVEASKIFASTTLNLNNATLVLDNESYRAELQAVGSIDITKPLNEVMCDIYQIDRGNCGNKYACVVVGGQPSCEPVKTEGDLGLALGLGIGIPLFILACLVVGVIVRYAVKSRRDNHSTDGGRDALSYGFITRGMPLKIDSWRRNDPVYKKNSSKWDSFYSSTVSDEDRNVEHDYPAQERYVGDNQPSNFSWDFLYRYIDPNESFHIQRPQANIRPHSVYEEGTHM